MDEKVTSQITQEIYHYYCSGREGMQPFVAGRIPLTLFESLASAEAVKMGAKILMQRRGHRLAQQILNKPRCSFQSQHLARKSCGLGKYQ